LKILLKMMAAEKIHSKEGVSSHNIENTSSKHIVQNLITYELHRCSNSGGFGFDLKGDRPAIIGKLKLFILKFLLNSFLFDKK
jgi:hypothetical protein